MEFKYLFIAEFIDGTIFEQTPEDKSTIDPTRNCYFDVLQSGKTIHTFSLVGQGNKITVDLLTGLFTINGLTVILEGERLPKHPDKFELIWYHQVTKDINVRYKVKSGNIEDVEELPEFREYFIGWQCNINGKNYQQKIAIA